MNVSFGLEEMKTKINYIKERKNPNLVEIKDLYLCEIRMLSHWERTSITSTRYKLSSTIFILAKRNKNNKYEDIFDLKVYNTENDITPDEGTFFVTRTSKINAKALFVNKKELHDYLLFKRVELIENALKNYNGNPKMYNCGNEEVCEACHLCGKIEYETSLLDINTFPICTDCYNNLKSTNYVKYKNRNL